MNDSQIDDELAKAAKEIRLLEEKTKRDKVHFIIEMKNGLGETIKENPHKVRFIKKPWYVRFGKAFKKIIVRIFTQF